VLKCHSKTVEDVMTPIDEVYSLNLNDELDEEAMAAIVAQGMVVVVVVVVMLSCSFDGRFYSTSSDRR